jgi:coenzyme F420-reducing hydrogenase beta subunit
MVAALKAFLGKNYSRLLTIDIVCHGVPNQRTFSTYIEELERKYSDTVISFSFRAKRDYEKSSVNPRTVDVEFKNGRRLNLDIGECEYLYGFHTGLFFRESCYACKYTCANRPADITLGDFWGVEKMRPELNSKKGVSLVRANTEKGEEYVREIGHTGVLVPMSYSFACAENEQLRKPSHEHRNKEKYFRLMKRGKTFCEAIEQCKRPDKLYEKVFRKIVGMIRSLKRK